MKNYYKRKAKKILECANLLSNSIKTNEKTEEEKVLESLKEAHSEWKNKEKYFQSVNEPELIDYAIYEMEASKIKYMYLLKKIKEMNLE
ncbi:uncharacterized protein DUF2508 [Keratinibaculum paraultunense]|uniref:Uncharacterized protein DUF2508 n=1 Tax=Keratinibaculum paraultunense TaxID=1278232 RepID=A0A4R3KTT2_9FIRM|nr:DUF2508 family protein [Keratinibaculum paraultunense]QQY79862.1 DUF2508 family protein [Keratinibaculum paraultunense]TCS88747.1 uncharacterized protein DUF2508 [Keratinibaculum paraultunense]